MRIIPLAINAGYLSALYTHLEHLERELEDVLYNLKWRKDNNEYGYGYNQLATKKEKLEVNIATIKQTILDIPLPIP